MGADESHKSPVDNSPPDLEESAKKILLRFLSRWFGVRGGLIIFVIVVGLVSFHSEVADVASAIRERIVESWPLPHAKPDVFTVAIARLESDDDKGDMESTIAADLREVGESNGIAVLEFKRAISDEDVAAGREKARK